MLMLATAVFSHRSWEPGAPYDSTEDALHSFSATAMGFAFALGVVSLALAGRSRPKPRRLLDLAAVAASIGLPLAMWQSPDEDGILQRLMFSIAYLWFATEAFDIGGAREKTP
jgi:hypothetical protein